MNDGEGMLDGDELVEDHLKALHLGLVGFSRFIRSRVVLRPLARDA